MPAHHPSRMAASNTILVLTALFCLRLCRGSRDQVQTGSPPKPSIWADPGPRVPQGSSVTIWCQGPPKASEFRLYNERDSEGEFMEESPAHSGQFYISLRNLNVHRTGQYQCSYSTAHHPEQRSDSLTLVLTGLFPAPLLEAHPSPVVASGRSVSLSCSTPNPNTTGTFHLLKEGDTEPRHLESQFSQGRWQANFFLGLVNASHGGNYSCYVSAQTQPYSWSLPSAPLRLQVTGTPPKPSIWADPSPLVPMGGSVTIWCRGPPKISAFRLYNERDSEGEYMEESPAHSGQAYISLRNMNVHRAGQYQCSYSTAHHPERSNNLILVLTGLFPAPLLEAHPSPVVASGRSVSLSCSTPNPNMMGTFHLLKEGDTEPQQLEPQLSQGRWQANFSLGPMNASHGGNYSCFTAPQSQPYSWSLPSMPLRLQVTGVFSPPSLSAQPSPLVQSGENVTLRCHSQKFSIFALTKGDAPPHSLHGQPSPNFPLGSVSASHGGQYRCFERQGFDFLWSEPSDPLDILVAGTGMGNSPELQALPEPNVPAGGNITLLCRSADRANTFYLAQESSATEPLQCSLPHPTALSQANFTLQPTRDGTYRCYSSNSSAPHLLSPPSKPLRLQVSDYTMQNFIRIGIAGCVLLLLTLLLFEAHHSQIRFPSIATR